MKFFGSSLAIRDNVKVAFFGKNLTNIISTENCATFISGNQYDRLSQQSFFVAVASLGNSSREKYINTTERQAQGASAVCNKDFKLQISAQHSWSVPNLLRGRPTDLSSKTVVQFHRIDNSKKPETVTRHFLNFCPNKPLSSYLWWPMMKSNFYPFFRF